MALDFDVTLSNLYKYRTGKGNPTAKTIDKIIKAVEKNCPELLEKEEKIGGTGDEQEKTAGSV